MRPDEMIEILKKKPTVEAKDLTLLNARQLLEVVDELGRIPSMESVAMKVAKIVRSARFDAAVDDRAVLTAKDGKVIPELGNAVGELVTRRNVILGFLAATQPKDPPESVYLELPEAALQSPEVFNSYIARMATSVDRLMRAVCVQGFNVSGVRQGSVWLQLVAEALSDPVVGTVATGATAGTAGYGAYHLLHTFS